MPEDTRPEPGADRPDEQSGPAGDDTLPVRDDDTRAAVEPAAAQDGPESADPPGPSVPPVGPGDTRPMPRSATWSGRAEVPAGRPAEPAARDWEARDWEAREGDQRHPDGGRWWMPIVVGLVALVLLGVLGFGLWLIGTAEDQSPPASPTATATAAPTSTAPSPTADEPTPTPERIEVPELVGEQVDDAQDALDELGLTYRLRYEVTDEEEPGTVIRIRPDEGSLVRPGTRITLVVASAPPITDAPTPTATANG